MSFNEDIDVLYGNPYFSLNSSDNSNAFLAFSTNSKINLRLVNDVLNTPNEFGIAAENDSFQLVAGNTPFFSFQNNASRFSSDLVLDKQLTASLISNPSKITFDSPQQSFVSFGREQFRIDNTGLNVLTNLRVAGGLNLDVQNLPSKVVLLNDYNVIPPTVLPSSTSQGRLIFGNGTKFGIGTAVAKSKLHVYDGHALIESGFVAINDLYDTAAPLAPLHIRSQGVRVGTPQIMLSNSLNIPTVVLMADKPFIGIGTSEFIQSDNVSLYVKENIRCDQSITLKDLYIENNLHMDSSNLTFWDSQEFNISNAMIQMTNSDILFNGLSTSNAVMRLFGKMNDIFGSSTITGDYRVTVSNDTSNVLAVGTTSNVDTILTLYRNDSIQDSINIAYKGGDDLYINSNKIIKDNDINKLAYRDDYDFSELLNNPFITSNVVNSHIVDIASENRFTLMLLNDGSLYYIRDNTGMTRLFPWFQMDPSEYIVKIKLQNNLLMYFTSMKRMFYNYINDSTVYDNTADCVNACFNMGILYCYSESHSIFQIIVASKQKIQINAPFIPTDIGLINNMGVLRVVFYSGDIIYDDVFTQIDTSTTNQDYSYYYSYRTNSTLLTVQLFKNNVLNINESFTGFSFQRDDVVYAFANGTYILFIDKEGAAYYIDGTYSINLIALNHQLLNTSHKIHFIKGIIYADYMVLYDDSYNTLFTRGFTKTNFNGLGRGPVTSMGVIPANELVPIMVPVNNNNIFTTDNMIIGSSMRYLSSNNIPTNSLSIENCLGIRVPANDMYSLNINGNINIVGGDILLDGMPLKLGGNSISSNIAIIGNSEGYINVLNYGIFFNQEIEAYRTKPTGFYNKIESDSKFMTIDQTHSAIMDSLQPYMTTQNYEINKLWHKSFNANPSYDIIFATNTSVVINGASPQMHSTAAGIIPALYVANSGNLRGILCDDNIAAYSDIKLKKNLEKIQDPLDKVQQLNGYYYNRTDDPDPNRRHVGLIAQEVEMVLPELVSTFNGMKTLSYQNIIALLIEAIKEITNKINNK